MDLSQHIRTIPDFPKPGILFYDISTLLIHPAGWQVTVERLAEAVAPHEPDVLVGIESRGFLVAAPLALKLGLGFLMVAHQAGLVALLLGRRVARLPALVYAASVLLLLGLLPC